MKTKRLAMCNYFAMCNNNGDVIGHSDKVTKEYFELLKNDFEVELIATHALVKSNETTDFHKIVELPYEINIEAEFTLKRRIADKIHSIKNIRRCFESDAEILFFYQLDFFLFFYLAFFCRKSTRNVYGLIFHQDFTGGILEPILQKIYHLGLRKMKGVMYTRPGAIISHPNGLWIPDFYYDDSIYGEANKVTKKNQVVCLGCMNRYKQLEKLVDLFKNSDMDLFIIGAFDIPEREKKLIEVTNGCPNIHIENRILSNEEYYQILSESKYSILPYDMSIYTARTSGVLLESIFVGSIPIAPKGLLVANKCPGIGYDAIEELDVASKDLFGKKYGNEFELVFQEERKAIIDNYSSEFVSEQMKKMFLENVK